MAKGILVILEDYRVFASFLVFKGILEVKRGIQVVLEVFGSYWVKWMGY